MLKVPEHLRGLCPAKNQHLLSDLARQAAQHSARKSAVPIPSFEKDSEGRPVPSGTVFWSLSHKPSAVGGVAALESVGLDVEEIRPVSSRLFKRIISNKEAERFLKEDREMAFFRGFTAKEAVLKMMGAGLKGLSKTKICDVADLWNLCIEYEGKKCRIEHFYFDNCLAAVTKNQSDICWTLDKIKGEENGPV